MKASWNQLPYWLRRGKSRLILLLIIGIQTVGNVPAFAQPAGKTTSLFDGKTLNGWKTVDPKHARLWSVADSLIKSGDGINKIPENTYLHTLNEYGDFEFRCLFRLHGDPATGMINSGIQYRSVLEGGKIVGYQADMGTGYWGDLYDEHRGANWRVAI